MRRTPLAKCTSEQLVIEAAAFTAMAARANTLPAQRALETLAERFRDLAIRRAALACLPDDDPAAPVLARTIERLIADIGEGRLVIRR
jgi:hypothetical protein